MSLLESFSLIFSSDGLKKLADETSEAKEKLDEFEQQAQQAEEKTEELNETVVEAADTNQDFNKSIVDVVEETKELNEELNTTAETLNTVEEQTQSVAAKNNTDFLSSLVNVKKELKNVFVALQPFLVLGKAIHNTMQFASDALEVAEAAKKAGMSLEAFQLADGNKYAIYTRDDINNAKEYEQTMRDVRMGTAAIGANISRMLLPALIQFAKISKQVVDFFIQHGEFIRILFIGLSTVITIMAIPAIQRLGAALLGIILKNPLLLGLTVAFLAIALIVDDLITYIKGGDAAFSKLWTNIFGGSKEAKKFIDDLKNTLIALWELLKPLAEFILKVVILTIVKGLELIVGTVKVVKDIIERIGNLTFKTKSSVYSAGGINGSHAQGLNYVPYDGYIAKLHKGESVLTADEAADWRSGLLAAKKAINFTSNFPLNSIPNNAISNAYNNSNRVINIGDITINTQATDSNGIATDLKDYIKQAIISLDDGMLA